MKLVAFQLLAHLYCVGFGPSNLNRKLQEEVLFEFPEPQALAVSSRILSVDAALSSVCFSVPSDEDGEIICAVCKRTVAR